MCVASLPICSLSCRETYAFVGDFAIEKDSNIRCSTLWNKSLPPLQTFPAHKPRSPKKCHVAAMLFQTGSHPWDISAQEAEGLFTKITCSSSLPASTHPPFSDQFLPSPTLQPCGQWDRPQCPVSRNDPCPRPGQSEGPTGLRIGTRMRKYSDLSSESQSQDPHERYFS